MQSILKAFCHLPQALRMHHLHIRTYSADCLGILRNYEFKNALSRERARAERTDGPLSLVVMWHVKDERSERLKPRMVMKSLARVLRKRVRCTDVVGRLDNGKLGVILPHTYADSAWAVLRDSFEKLSLQGLGEGVADKIIYRVYSNKKGGGEVFKRFDSICDDVGAASLNSDIKGN